MLYKFFGPGRISVLENLLVRFTQPSELNDPFESAVLVDAGNFIQIEDKLKEMMEEFDPQDDEERAMLADAKAEMREYAEQKMRPQEVGRGLIDYINRAQGVLSLSRANDNLLMWAHYGDSHKGYVIGLDENHEWFRGLDGFGNPTKPHNVIYTSRRSTIKVGSEDFYERLLCYKSVEWAYEEEVRIFRTFGTTREQFDSNSPTKIHLFKIPDDCIKEVFIGANASDDTRRTILQAVRINELNVKVFEAYVNDERYELNFRRVFDSMDYRQRSARPDIAAVHCKYFLWSNRWSMYETFPHLKN